MHSYQNHANTLCECTFYIIISCTQSNLNQTSTPSPPLGYPILGDCCVCGVLGAMVEVKHSESLFVRKSIANYHQKHRDMMEMMRTNVTETEAMKNYDDEVLSDIA